MKGPLVSVIIPVYNREAYIAESIQSILEQSYQNIEILVVDDASTDGTVEVIKKIMDSRIQLIPQHKNKGVSSAFNLGIKNAKGKFIARLDSDDIAVPDRIKRQVNYFRKNPETAICGSWLMYMNAETILKFPKRNAEIINLLLLRCPISIGTSMFRKEVFEKFNFDESLRFGEDYEFWSRALFIFKAYNIEEPLVFYRQHEFQLTKTPIKEQQEINLKIQFNLLEKFPYDQNIYPKNILSLFLLNSNKYEFTDALKFLRFLKKLKGINLKHKIMPNTEFKRILEKFRDNLTERFFFRNNPNLNLGHRIFLWLRLSSKKKAVVLTRKLKEKRRQIFFF